MLMPRYQLGEEAIITVQVANSSLSPAHPDAAPTARIYSSANALIATVKLPPKDIKSVIGLFEHFVRLDRDYAVGVYSWRADWTVATVSGVQEGVFEIVAGGSQDGAVIAMGFFVNPEGSVLIQHLEADTDDDFRFGRNPRT